MGVEGTLPMALRSVVGEDFVKKDMTSKKHTLIFSVTNQNCFLSYQCFNNKYV